MKFGFKNAESPRREGINLGVTEQPSGIDYILYIYKIKKIKIRNNLTFLFDKIVNVLQ